MHPGRPGHGAGLRPGDRRLPPGGCPRDLCQPGLPGGRQRRGAHPVPGLGRGRQAPHPRQHRAHLRGEPAGVRPDPADYEIIKPRYSAFFQTALDLLLRRLGVDTVLLTGTTTPNCIRTTCYDAISLDYRVVVVEDCCSSNTEEIQRANMLDMANVGALIRSSEQLIEELER